MDYELEERIAIMIHDGGLQPAEAERLARQPQQPPVPVPAREQPTEQAELFGEDGYQQARQYFRKMFGNH